MTRRERTLRAKWLPNGDIRFYKADEKKSGVGELRCNAVRNPASTVVCSTMGCIIVDYEFD